MATSTFVPAVAYHPGETLAEKLTELGMSIKEFALRTSKPEKTIHAVIKGESAVTSDMAVAFESVTKIPAHFWLSKQRNYDEYLARLRREAMMEEACDWARLFPYAQMVKLGWVTAYNTIQGKAKELLSFFQISSVQAWEDYYLHQKLKIAFRISLAHTKDPHAISAWLRQGEIQASNINVEEYSEAKLKEAIPVLKSIMVEQPYDFASKAQQICAEAGVKLIYTQCLPKAPIGGSTRWINGIPCIQISGRQKRYDIYWFTLFHEIGHILLHGKKDIFLEDDNYSDEELTKENEANNYASNILLSQMDEESIIESGKFSPISIRQYAARFNTHPSVIVGRLQHRHAIPFSKDNSLLIKIDLFQNAEA